MKESFRDFMWRALYHPERGYYSKRIRTVGASGDFSTSASLNPPLAHAIARWIKEESRATGVIDIIEIGGGDGSLLKAIRTCLGWWSRLKLRFHLVEISDSLQDVQADNLGRRSVQWHTSLSEVLRLINGRAIIYHNELMDAFPVELVQFDPDSRIWNTISLSWKNGLPTEELDDPLSRTEPFSVLATAPVRPQRAEVATDLHAWFQDWLPLWRAGAMLSIDYGDKLPTLYEHRRNGSVRGYILQQRVEGSSIYLNVGRQDLTADVNFTDVVDWLKHGTQREPVYETQLSFIQRMGLQPQMSHSDADQAFKCVTVRL
ncbi:MAG: SAM-dependent methyltransferase [Verrucomicrobiaceae bacterium]|nr:SAM-dependent methyltransferase [Verrucomicrobiaceae bacterium]